MTLINIIPYQPKHHKNFKSLSLEWLNQYDLYEDEDGYMLDNPNKLILDKGGKIYMAELDGEIVGVVALTIITKKVYEIHKLGVSSAHQGQGIGLKLMNYCLGYCKKIAFRKLFLKQTQN